MTTEILICAGRLAVLLPSRIITQTTARVEEAIASCNFASFFCVCVCLNLVYCYELSEVATMVRRSWIESFLC